MQSYSGGKEAVWSVSDLSTIKLNISADGENRVPKDMGLCAKAKFYQGLAWEGKLSRWFIDQAHH